MIQRALTNTLRYDPDQCVNCGLCSIVCPHGVFAPGARLPKLVRPRVSALAAARLSPAGAMAATVLSVGEGVAQLVRPEDCMECGACQLNCPTGAIQVQSGVGCAAAMIRAALTGGRETCGCDDDTACCS